MNITKETKLAELLSEYPWLKEEITKVNEKFKMLHSPLGNVMAKKVTIADMSEKSGMDADEIIDKLKQLIESHI
jgi:hypothetical protein